MSDERSRMPDAKAKAPLQFVHCDLAGPIEQTAREGFKYALCFTDDFSSLITMYFLKNKSDTVKATKKFLADVAPYGCVKRLRSDNGGEFISKEFKELMLDSKIKHETSAPRSPHQNGSAERQWRTVFEMARCMLIESGLPKYLWTYAVMSAAYIRNRCYNPRITKTPFEAFTGIRPNVSNMHSFGTQCFAYVDEKKKLDARSEEGVFVGYDRESPAFLVYFSMENKIKRVRCVKFTEKKLVSEQNEESVPIRYNDVSVDVDRVIENQERDDAIVEGDRNNKESNRRYPSRDRSMPKKLDDYVVYSVDSQASVCVDYCYRVGYVPQNFPRCCKV